VRHALTEAAIPAQYGLGLHDALRARIARLPTRQREILGVLAVSVAPLEIGVLAQVTACELAVLHRDLASLRAANLIAMSGARMTDAVDLYHDQIGVAMRARLDEPSAREWHRRLAIGLEASGPHDPDRLTMHWLAAGAFDRAITSAIQAAGE